MAVFVFFLPFLWSKVGSWWKLSVTTFIINLLYKNKNVSSNKLIHSYFYSTRKHEIIQISDHNLPCSFDPPNQGLLFWLVGPKLINDTEYNWLHIGKELIGRKEIVRWSVAGWDQRDFYVELWIKNLIFICGVFISDNENQPCPVVNEWWRKKYYIPFNG